jgi:excisionase family DNA binding protein
MSTIPSSALLTLSITEAAEATGLSIRYIRRLVYERRIQSIKVGKLVRIRPDDLSAYLVANTRPARGAA